MTLGDSKTAGSGGYPWQPTLQGSLLTATGQPWQTTTNAIGGLTLASALSQFTSLMAMSVPSADRAVKDVLLNFGVNDLASVSGFETTEGRALWRSQWVAMFDAVHARFANARIWVMRPWSALGADASYDVMAGDIATAVADRSSYTFVGPDERVWLKGGDDGATMTLDGVHYSAAGSSECAAQWATTLGY